MDLRRYLLDTFGYNDQTNLQLLKKISELPDPSLCIKYFSHLINSQYKWMARIMQDPAAPQMDWWEPVYPYEELAARWKDSLDKWKEYLAGKSEAELTMEVSFTGYDGSKWAATPADIALQLNYHSIHHRAQMQTIIREQGLEPDFVDYIGTRYRKINK